MFINSIDVPHLIVGFEDHLIWPPAIIRHVVGMTWSTATTPATNFQVAVVPKAEASGTCRA